MVKLVNASEIADHPDLQYYIYNGLDSCVTHELFDILHPKTWDLYDFERLLLGPVMTMMRRGFRVDLTKQAYLEKELEERREKIETRLKHLVHYLTGMEDFNHKSPKQLQRLLYDELELPKQYAKGKANKDGEKRITTDRDSLERLRKSYVATAPVITLILGARDVKKTLEVVTQGLSPAGRWHANFNIGGTETGRFSSSKHPYGIGANLQNITGKLRQLFVPDEGYALVSVDLKTAESKGVAYLAEDDDYIEACNSEDVHTLVAKEVWPDKVQDRTTAEAKYYRDYSYRDMSKRGQHGSNYMGTPYTMSRHLKVTQQVMKDFQHKYFKRFSGIPEWHRSVAVQLQTEGVLTTPLGRRRQFWGRLRDDSTLREAVAFVPQSLIADTTNIGLYKIWYHLEPLGVQILAQVHDSVVMQIPVEKLDELLPLVVQYMTCTIEVNGRPMTISVDAEVGYNWGKYHPEKNPDGLLDINKERVKHG